MKILTVSVLAFISYSIPCYGTTIVFGGAFFADAFSADGTALESGASAGSATGEVTFRLGVFVDVDNFGVVSEVTPSLDSVTEFSRTFLGLAVSDFNTDPITLDDGTTTAPANNFGAGIEFDVTSTLSHIDGTVSAVSASSIAGFQLYIFGYDTFPPDISSTEAELFLVTGDDFVTPNVNAPGGGNSNFPVVVDVNNASTAVIGRIDNGTGEGETEGNPFLGPDGLQFAIVPEPSSLVLVLLSGLSLFRRRRCS